MNRRKRPTHPNLDETPEQNLGPEADTGRLQRVEERLVADVDAVESGRVRLTKRVVEEPESLDVDLRHDEPVADRGEETVVLVI